MNSRVPEACLTLQKILQTIGELKGHDNMLSKTIQTTIGAKQCKTSSDKQSLVVQVIKGALDNGLAGKVPCSPCIKFLLVKTMQC